MVVLQGGVRVLVLFFLLAQWGQLKEVESFTISILKFMPLSSPVHCFYVGL